MSPAAGKEIAPRNGWRDSGSDGAGNSKSPPRLDLSGTTVGCRPEAPNDVIVCRQRGTNLYRIDPTVLKATRVKELAENPPRPTDPSVVAESCAVGPIVCPGAGSVDFIGPLILLTKSLVNAAQGKDWREPFRTKPDDYQLHEQAKRDGATR